MKNDRITLLFIALALLTKPALAEERKLTYDNLQRRYLIEKPTNARDGKELPVIIALHGGGGSPEKVDRMTVMTQKALARGFMIVYPGGSGSMMRIKRFKTWNATHCCGYSIKENVDDLGFIGTIIDSLIKEDHADPKRIYVTGMSNGAMFAHQIGIALADKIAAIAPVAGGLFGDEIMPASGVAALFINGKLDRSVNIGGGKSNGRAADTWDNTPLKPVSYQAKFWTEANGCKNDSKTTQESGGKVSIQRYNCPQGLDVVQYIVNDNAHAWPGGNRGSPVADTPSSSLNATDVILQFFADHSK